MTLFNKTVIMSDAQFFRADHPINPYYGSSPIISEQAQTEHDEIKKALESAGITVKTVPSPSTSQDGVYTANWALVRGDKAVIARLPEVRKSEEAHAASILKAEGKEVFFLPEDVKFSGQGDALPCGDYLLCGRNYRSDEAAQAMAADILGFTRIQLETIPQRDNEGNAVINPSSGWADSFFYDIDLALAVIRPPRVGSRGLIAYCPEAFTEESRTVIESLTDIDTIIVSLTEATEAFATNLVSTGETVILSDSAPLLKAELESRGLKTRTPHITELSKGGGYIRCTTLSID